MQEDRRQVGLDNVRALISAGFTLEAAKILAPDFSFAERIINLVKGSKIAVAGTIDIQCDPKLPWVEIFVRAGKALVLPQMLNHPCSEQPVVSFVQVTAIELGFDQNLSHVVELGIVSLKATDFGLVSMDLETALRFSLEWSGPRVRIPTVEGPTLLLEDARLWRVPRFIEPGSMTAYPVSCAVDDLWIFQRPE